MSESPEGRADKAAPVRVFAGLGCLLFLALAIKMGAESYHARSVGSQMSNWKGGTMVYQDGFKLTVVFAAFAVAFCYFAFRTRDKRWSQGRTRALSQWEAAEPVGPRS